MAKKMNKEEEVVEEVPKIDFNVWFAMREKKIPSQHLREIIWADFRSRGLSAKETLESYDKAIKAYGLKL